jgi:hypothetical protein
VVTIRTVVVDQGVQFRAMTQTTERATGIESNKIYRVIVKLYDVDQAANG